MYCYTPTYYFGTEPQKTGAIKNLTYKKSEKKARRNFKYKYNGKELQDELGLDVYDYGARVYDPALSRFWTIDPMADERTWVSPYNYVQNNPLNRIDPDGKLDWEPVKGQPGKWIAQPGDSAWTLSKDANISPEKANQIVESQLGPNYVKDGKVYSNVEVGDVVVIEPENVAEVKTEEFIKYPENYEENKQKIRSINKQISAKEREYENYQENIKSELRDNPDVYERNSGGMYSQQYLSNQCLKKISSLEDQRDSIEKINKPDTFKYQVIRVIKVNDNQPTINNKQIINEKDKF